MKKRVIVFIFIFLILNIIIAKADIQIPGSGSDVVNPETGVPKSVEDIGKVGDKVIQTNASYLRKELFNIADKSSIFGGTIRTIGNIFSIFDFFWQPVFGLPFTWSLAFLFSLILFIILAWIIFIPLDSFMNNKLFAILISIIITSIVGLAGVIKNAVNTIETAITVWWMAIVALLLAILFMILYEGGVRSIIKKIKEESKKENLENAEEEIKTAGKGAKKINDSYKGN